MNPLLVIFKPREIPETNEAFAKIKGIAKLWIKYYSQPDAYAVARHFFLSCPDDYTHFIIAPDDLIVTQEDIDAIMSCPDAFDSISGWCNNTGRADGEDYIDTNIAPVLPPDPPHTALYEGYQWYKIEQLEQFLKAKQNVNPNNNLTVMPVLHQGFALSRLSRRLIETVPFRTDEGCCVDSCLSLDLEKQKTGIMQFVNLDIRMQHLRIPRTELLVGKEKAVMLYEK